MKHHARLFVAIALFFATVCATPPHELIHPGDQLSVTVYGQQTLSQNVTVLPDGAIEYPLIGRVQVAGLSVDDATKSISLRLAKYVRHPYVTVAIAQLGQPNVLVLGNVKTPGKYQLRSDAKVTDAIAAAGGIADQNGELPDARVSDSQGNVQSVSLQKLLHDGDTSLDHSIGEGSVVYVPGPTLMNVTVTGAVDHPGEIQVAEGDRLSMAIARAGNSASSNADLNNIRVLRTGSDGKQQEYTVNLYQALEKGDTSADIVLQKGDEVYVPVAHKGTNVWSNGGILYILSRLIPIP
ncbi:MAG: polysaccharide biosynthesis/export family protein [Candidatus Eremiobacteraeota bacterium]|nr:polysaccharide biosynthesis/export family protein [Candidatus Eremiobacteraeota bacterium]